MIVIDLISNLALLVALIVVSGFVGQRCRRPVECRLFQGLLFGAAAVVGMMRPVTIEPGVFFDGRSVLLSLCAFFFGPWAAAVAGAMAIVCRVYLGGPGWAMGVSTVVVSAVMGWFFRRGLTGKDEDVSAARLFLLGWVVHVGIVLLMFELPRDAFRESIRHIAPLMLLMYPLATVLMGKVLSDQRARSHFLQVLRDSREMLRTTLYSMGDGVVATDGEGRVRQLNPVAERLLGWSEPEAFGKPCGEVFQLVDEESGTAMENPVLRVLREGRTVEWTEHALLQARDGTRRAVTNTSAPIRNADGGMVGVVLAFQDRTAERQALKEQQAERDQLRAVTEALRESEQRYRVLADSGVGLIWTTTADNACDYVNQPALVFTGSTLAQAAGSGWMDCVHPEDRASVLPLILATMGRRERFSTSFRMRRYDGVYRWMQNNGMPRYDTQGRFIGYIGHCLDITETRLAEESLRRIQWMLSKKPRGAFHGGAAEGEGRGSLVKMNGENLIVRTVGSKMLASIVDEYLDLLGTCSVILDANGGYAFETFESTWCRLLDRATMARCGDGTPSSALASGGWLCHEACWAQCAKQVVAQRVTLDVECHAGLRIYAAPIFARNEVVGVIAFGYGDPPRDPSRLQTLSETSGVPVETLTAAAEAYDSRPPYIIEMAKSRLQSSAWLIGALVEAHQTEEARAALESQLHQIQKMDAIGRLAGGVAHDFNNILQSIIGYGELLLDKLAKTDEAHEFADEILSESKRAVALTRHLLTFARKQVIDPKVFDLNVVVSATLKMLNRLVGESIELEWRPDAQRCFVKMDATQVDQILTNLTVNARDALNGVGKVVIETGTEALDERQCLRYPGLLPGRYVTLSVADGGCGMERATLDRLFEPFFTTKERGKGTGLGLATVYGIVKQNQGYISVQSAPGRGSIFKIYLPEHIAPTEHVEESVRGGNACSGHETVLVVDDEESLLRAGRRMLETLGYVVLAAAGPDEALRLVKSYPNEIHVLLTDVVMPGMSGRDLWRKIERMRPTMKCIYMSGFTANIIAQRNALDRGVNFLQKPFTKTALANKVHEVLSAVDLDKALSPRGEVVPAASPESFARR